MIEKMSIVFVTTEELCPETMLMFGHWKKLKAQHPRLKLTAFCPGKYKDKKENDLVRNKNFWKFYRENKEWVEIAANGVTWQLPPEFTKFRGQQESFIKRMNAKLRKYFPEHRFTGFKAPYAKINEVTMGLIQQFGYSYVVHNNAIMFLKEVNHYPFGYIMLHARMNHSEDKDNISQKREMLHKLLKHYEKRGITYFTIGEYINRFKVV